MFQRVSSCRPRELAMQYTIALPRFTEEQLNQLPFGVIHLDANGLVLEYNAYEASLSRLKRADVLGRNFFEAIAPCTNVPEFYGRFKSGISGACLHEEFSFRFPFSTGTREVMVHMVYDRTSQSAWLFVSDPANGLSVLSLHDRTLRLSQRESSQ